MCVVSSIINHLLPLSSFFFFFFNDTATTEIYTLSYTTLFRSPRTFNWANYRSLIRTFTSLTLPIKHLSKTDRSEEHTSELQSRRDLVCRLLLEKKKKTKKKKNNKK